ncbi:MAG: hypothetical protein A3B73_05580 [Omnitrophica WOR_2 bacterium RIFCSPHIGHO2_02_FULL_63_39]|nr:MAG: hypothetical protein A3B73_05580 [Omnitrophica WOR_2 bacterium RIFCSPHIGHO2_02_FULL_63_39]OGX47229.1 MAG: hypothetical protein A3G88_07420 [Omnitrophica WOR_2 bacterium RIFCSPLOWO2_12_FULL_63_16]
MKTASEVVAGFFLDGAKIIFASLVVGLFVPGAVQGIPWVTLTSGLVMTVVFLGIAIRLSTTVVEERPR